MAEDAGRDTSKQVGRVGRSSPFDLEAVSPYTEWKHMQSFPESQEQWLATVSLGGNSNFGLKQGGLRKQADTSDL